MGIGPESPDQRGRRAFVGLIRVPVDEENTNRFAAKTQQAARLLLDLPEIHWRVHGAIGQGALGDFKAQVARHERNELASQTPRSRPVAATHLEHVGKSFGRDQTRARQFALQQRIGGHGGAMDDRHDAGEVLTGLLHTSGMGKPGHEPACLLAARRWHLDDAHSTARLVQDEEIGERPPDIHTHDQTVDSRHDGAPVASAR